MICLFVLLGYRIYSIKTPVEFYVFDTCGGCNVQNPCKPCEIFQALINKYKRTLAENGLQKKTVFKPYNIYMDNDSAAYRKNVAAIGLEEIPSLPAAIVGGKLISGEIALDENLISAVKSQRRFVLLVKQFFCLSGNERKKVGVYDEKTIINFSLSYCEDCKKTDAFLAGLPGVRVVKIDPSSAEGRVLYEKYCEVYGIQVDDYIVPRLFAQKSSFTGYQEASRSLENILAGNSKTVKIELE
jgi:thiol-disulfide isomerase/thioredoxin